MSHTKKKTGVPDALSGTPLFSVCGILCGQLNSASSNITKKLIKIPISEENGYFLELLGRFELPTSSLPSRPKNFFRAFLLVFGHFCSVSTTLWPSLAAVLPSFPGVSVAGYVVNQRVLQAPPAQLLTAMVMNILSLCNQ